MEKQVEYGTWIEVNTNCGISFFPADLLDNKDIIYLKNNPDVDDIPNQLIDKIKQYIEGNEIWTVEVTDGYGARLSAPGYMDCTEWSVFETEQEAIDYIDEFYGDDEE
ncbi:MAG: hypothetical protein AABY32_01675 [Nanoarchaeota archaeon]